MQEISLSILLPVRNLGPRLPALVAECLSVAARHVSDYELIVVVDGDSDGTGQRAEELAAIHAPLMVLRYPRRYSYRFALADAWSVARGEYVLALDEASQASIGELPRMLPYLPGHALVQGYRSPPPAGPQGRLAARMARAAGRNIADLRDPLFRCALARADLHPLLPAAGPDATTHADLFAQARHEGLPLVQVALRGRAGAADRLRPEALLGSGPPALRQAPALGALALVAGGLWLLRRWLPGARDQGDLP